MTGWATNQSGREQYKVPASEEVVCRNEPVLRCEATTAYPPPPCISYANVHNYSGPYAYCSLDKGVACVQHIQLPTHTSAGHMC